MKINFKKVMLSLLFVFMVSALCIPVGVNYTLANENIIFLVEATVENPVVGNEQPQLTIDTQNVSLYAYEWYYQDSLFTMFESFVEGETYTLQARINTSKQFNNSTIVSVNGKNATIKTLETNSIVFKCDFVATKKIDAPIIIDGSAMAQKTTPTTIDLSQINSDVIEFCNNNCGCGVGISSLSNQWLDIETSNLVLSFENGKTYVYYLLVHFKTSYVLPNQIDNNFVKVSGIDWVETDCEKLGDNKLIFGGKIVYNSSTGIPKANIELDEIVIDGTSLIAKTTPTSINLSQINSDIIEFCNENCGCMEEISSLSNKWLDFETQNIASSFENGKTYIYYLVLHIKNGYVLPNQITDDFVKVDGVTWTETDCEQFGNDFVIWAGKIVYNSSTGIPTNKIAINFNANGGNGTMETLWVNAGTTKLPENTFTAPKGKKFKAWAIGNVDGKQYNANDELNIESELTLYAIWEDTQPLDILKDIDTKMVIITVGTLVGLGLFLSIIKKFKYKKKK